MSYKRDGDRESDSEIHASIIKFDGRGMIIPFWQWLQFEGFLRAGRLDNDVDWSKGVRGN